ncbi:MAG: hypothetical protein J3Q66DRAFT_334167 [Benniella sp.]|nr:MAG: hypothetical protein J3Q66DRAFT_334167 [Benniella sp.]
MLIVADVSPLAFLYLESLNTPLFFSQKQGWPISGHCQMRTIEERQKTSGLKSRDSKSGLGSRRDNWHQFNLAALPHSSKLAGIQDTMQESSSKVRDADGRFFQTTLQSITKSRQTGPFLQKGSDPVIESSDRPHLFPADPTMMDSRVLQRQPRVVSTLSAIPALPVMEVLCPTNSSEERDCQRLQTALKDTASAKYTRALRTLRMSRLSVMLTLSAMLDALGANKSKRRTMQRMRGMPRGEHKSSYSQRS